LFSQDTINYLKQAVEQGRVSRGPVDLQILPTTRCNARCVFCPSHAVSEQAKAAHAPRWLMPDTDLNIGMMDRLFDDLYRLGGLRRVHITGGEPLLHNKMLAALFILRRNFPGVEISLVTNGILLGKAAESLVRAQINRVSVSVNAGDPQSFARQAGVKAENFEKIREGLKLLRKMRGKVSSPLPYLSLTAVLNRENCREAEKMLQFGIDSGADAVTYLALMDFPFPGEAAREFALSEAEFDEFVRELERLKPRAEGAKIFLGFTGKPGDQGKLRAGNLYQSVPCYSGYTFVMVWPDGSVRPCCNCETVLGSLAEQSFYQIWTSKRAQEIRERMFKIAELGPPELCDCLECGYLYENQEFHRRAKK